MQRYSLRWLDEWDDVEDVSCSCCYMSVDKEAVHFVIFPNDFEMLIFCPPCAHEWNLLIDEPPNWSKEGF